jgi:hypothetical protein
MMRCTCLTAFFFWALNHGTAHYKASNYLMVTGRFDYAESFGFREAELGIYYLIRDVTASFDCHSSIAVVN